VAEERPERNKKMNLPLTEGPEEMIRRKVFEVLNSVIEGLDVGCVNSVEAIAISAAKDWAILTMELNKPELEDFDPFGEP